MGMSASQIRFILITATKSNVEYAGQQINQARMMLASRTAEFNSELLELRVPVPPSSDEYTKTSYSFMDSNNAKCTVSGTTYNAQTNTYSVSYTRTAVSDQGKRDGSANFVFTNPNYQLYNPNANALSSVLTPVDFLSGSPEANQNNAIVSLICKDMGIEDAHHLHFGDPGYQIPPFLSYVEDGQTKYVVQSVLSANAGSSITNLGTAIPTYYIDKNATVTTGSQMTNANVSWSSSGRMTSITDSSGHVYPLTVSSEADTAAYTDAMNNYTYQQGLYSEKMAKINASLAIVQSQDKKLELELKDLDTQQQALSTEMDAVKKVIDKNIGDSFKSFSGSG